jgi:4-amino-4-deoxy-L-arabinose transferase-like glycosyltransferase
MKLLRNKIFILIIAALCTRGAAIIAFHGVGYYGGITDSYLQVIQNFFDGRGFVFYVNIAPTTAPEPHWSYEPLIDRPMGFVLLLLVPSVISLNPIGAQLFFGLLSICSVLLLYLWGRNIADDRIAFVAALLYAVWPVSARFETVILPDAVMPLFLLGALWLIDQSMRNKRPYRTIVLAGITLGAAATVRPDIVLLPFFLAAVVLSTGTPRRWKLITVLLGGFVLVVALHTFRNYQATDGKFVPLGLGNGISMWEGISQFGDTLGTVFGDERMVAREGYHSWAYPNGVEREQERFREALEIIREHPVWYAGVMLKRIWILLKPDGIITTSLAPAPREYFGLHRNSTLRDYLLDYPAASIIQILLVLAQLAALGLAIITLARFFDRHLLWLPAITITYYIAVHICTNTEARYFYPVTPLVLFLAAYGWTALQPPQEKG